MILAVKMMSENHNSPLKQYDHQVKLHMHIHFIGPSDLVLMSSRVLYYISGTYLNRLKEMPCFRTQINLVNAIMQINVFVCFWLLRKDKQVNEPS
jgi:hypothetical protein